MNSEVYNTCLRQHEELKSPCVTCKYRAYKCLSELSQREIDDIYKARIRVIKRLGKDNLKG